MNLEYPIYCINLVERTDRKQHVINEFSKINIDSNNVIFLHLTKDIKGGKHGCYESHTKIWNEFYKNSNSNFCLIFEDDFLTNLNCKYILEKGEKFMNDNYNNVDFLLLHNLYTKLNSNILSKDFERGMSTDLHAYFISRNYIESLINKSKYNWLNFNGVAVDLAVNFDRKHTLYSDKCYFSKQEAFTQIFILESPSDISNNFVDFICRIPMLKWVTVYNNGFFLNFFDENILKDKYMEENIKLLL